jgi:hypothetical protein
LSGFFRSGRLRTEGMMRVLALRSRYAAQRRLLSDPGKYVDLRYWESAREGTAAGR